MTKRKSFITLLLMTLLLTLATSTGVFATVTTDTVTTSATANYTLYYDSSNGKMYTNEYASNQYTGQSDKWSSAYNAEAGSYILTLKGFNFTTSQANALVLPYDTVICLANGTTNILSSTFTGNDYSTGLLAFGNLTIYSNVNGTGKLSASSGTSTGEYYSDGICCENTLTIVSGTIWAFGGTDVEATGIDTYTFSFLSGDVLAAGDGYSLYFLSDDGHQMITFEDGTIFIEGYGPQDSWQRNVTNGSTDDTLFDNYPYLHIYHTLSDVPCNAWYYQNILDLYDAGIIAGYANSDGLSCQIRPANSITRAEFVTILARLFESDSTLAQYAGEYTFTDVPTWASKYVGWATANGYVKGINSATFGSGDNITREQMAAILCRVVEDMELTSNSSNPAITFTDEGQIADYALAAVRTMQQDGVINGYSNGDGSFRFQPKGTATRAEAFTMIHNFINAYLSK